MDLSYFSRRQRTSQSNASNAACENSRRAHHDMADAYGALMVTGRKVAEVELRP